ncbi:MAG: hypothetical protein GY828_07295 [Candidatus Gracilibacteria bacterium]|nr:hypothetical protein [Candidatus Gracilibacteria bacterium]
MDFKKLLDTTKEKTINYSKKAIKYSSEKLAESQMTLRNEEGIQKHIEKSGNTSHTNKETNETKTFTKQSILIYVDESSDFFKECLYIFPVLLTKGFSGSISVKLVSSNIADFDYSTYSVSEFPSLVLYENKVLKKVITGKEDILKLVKNIDLDINKQIENL